MGNWYNSGRKHRHTHIGSLCSIKDMFTVINKIPYQTNSKMYINYIYDCTNC